MQRKTFKLLTALLAMMPVLVFAVEAQTHHVHLAVSNGTEAVKWYVRHLGCSTIDERPEAIEGGAV